MMKKRFLLLPAITLSIGAIALVTTDNRGNSFLGFLAEKVNCNHVGNHYARKDQTLTSSGYKEFWACCKCQEQFLTKPTTGTFTDKSESQMGGVMTSSHIAYLPKLDEPTQDMFPNTLYSVYGTSSSSTNGVAPVETFTNTRINYQNRATDPSNYACVYNSSGDIVRYLKKGLYYTSLDDVCAYVLAFKEVPVNYLVNRNASKSVAYNEYGQEYARIAPGMYGLTSGYNGSYDNIDAYPYSCLPKSTDGNYFEMDVGYTWDNNGSVSNYAEGTSFSRGPLRLIVYWNGARSEGQELNERCYSDDNPVIFYTADHYSTCYEYSNYVGGWGNVIEKYDYANYTPLTTIN